MDEIVKRGKNSYRKIIWFLVIIIIILIIIILGTKIYLLFKFLIGNDIIINLETESQSLLLNHGESSEISFKTSTVTNLFCRAECSYKFEDISSGQIIDINNFSIKTLNPISKYYILQAPDKGTGQKLYRFDMQCRSIKTVLCQTSGELNKRTSMISLDYDLSIEEKTIKDNFKEEYLSSSSKIYYNLEFLKYLGGKLNNTYLEKTDMGSQINNLTNSKIELEQLKGLWENQQYYLLNESFDNFKREAYSEHGFNQFNASLLANISEYNQLSKTWGRISANIVYLGNISLSESSALEADNLINSTNQIIIQLKSNSSFDDKKKNILETEKKVNQLLSAINAESQINATLNRTTSVLLNNYIIPEIVLNFSIRELPFELKDPGQICCFLNDCKSCCDNLCYNGSAKYPIIFIHGHDFSISVSPEYNLNVFEEVQRELEKIGYINAGTLSATSSETPGILGKSYNPISIKASYYFDSIKNAEKINILYTKQDNIDTYSIRLKEIINNVKLLTNRDKVIIISHSMGGLVVRRYLQIFGDESVYKAILIASPNHGIDGEVYTSCKLFGAKTECEDMYAESLLMNKLNAQTNLPNTKVYNIVGLGCNTYGEDGDGIVKNSSAFLNFAENYYVSGNCTRFEYFHNKIINPLKTPETEKIIEEILKNNETAVSNN